MEYSQIILEMLERIKVLENKVQALEENKKADNHVETKPTLNVKPSAKYRGLTEYLLAQGGRSVTLTYDELEKVLGFNLPGTARSFKHSFWANTETHSYASSWMAIGYRTQVNIEKDEVTFYKKVI